MFTREARSLGHSNPQNVVLLLHIFLGGGAVQNALPIYSLLRWKCGVGVVGLVLLWPAAKTGTPLPHPEGFSPFWGTHFIADIGWSVLLWPAAKTETPKSVRFTGCLHIIN